MPEGGLSTEPCVVCCLPTHHICADKIHQDEDLTRRYCSLVCPTKSFGQVNELQTLLDVTKSLTKAIEKDVPSEGNVAQSVCFQDVKLKKTSKPKRNVNLASVTPKKKRTSTLNDLRGKYIGRIIELSGAQLFPKMNDNTIYKLQVVEVHRLRGECGKMVRCVTLVCDEHPAVSLKDFPVSKFQELLDNAQSEVERILRFDITEQDVQELVDKRRNRWRKKPRCIETEFNESEEETKSPPP
jgi:hypothetical protein